MSGQPVPPRVPRDQRPGCGCVAYLPVTVVDVTALIWAAAAGDVVLAAVAGALLLLVTADACRRRRGVR